VLSTINFDNQAAFHTHKINDVTAYRFLKFKFQLHEAVRAQVIPQPLLCDGLVST